MSDFLMSCSCKGRRPKYVASSATHSRPHLIADLLRSRDVARFLVAPAGFGKSTVAAEYAQVVFSFRQTFWVNCESPCFLRDLDAGIIASRVAEIGGAGSLVVFDDLPRMDASRVEAFSEVVDELLAAGSEVLATCTPTCDAYSDLHRDRVKLSARRFLLTDDEMKHTVRATDSPHAKCRAACVAWGSDDGGRLVAGMAAEEPPASVLLAAFLMLAMGEGSLSELVPLVGARHASEAFSLIEEDYPFLGVSAREDSFDAVAIDVPVLAQGFSRAVDRVVDGSTCGDASELAVCIAAMLLERGAAARACAVVRSFATKPACASWLAAHGADLLSAACFKPAHELYVYAGKNARQNRILLAADEAVRLAALDDAVCALFLARKFAFSRSIDPESRSRLLLVASCLGSDEDRRRAESVAAEFAACAKVGGPIAPAAALSLIAAHVGKGVMPLAEAWSKLASRGASDGSLAFAAALALRALAQKKTPGFASPEDARAVERVALWACDLAARTPSDAMSWQCAFLVMSLSRAVEEGSLPTRFLPAAETLAAARAIEAARFTECAAHRRDSLREERARAERERSSRDRYAARPIRPEAPGAPESSAPILYVRLLGGLDVRIGEQQVDMQAFSRQKTKTLLALLVLARGRELSRERLLETLWPDSPHGCAIKNFYSVWSQLKRGLDYEGTCPYLLRDQGGVRLDARLLRSDVAELDSICRALSFGEIDLDRWRDHLEAIDESYSGDLLPSESVNDDIAAARRRLRINLVDSLVCASGRLLESGEPRAALWFAREAAGRDRSREDACAALMEAQLGAGQRAAAIDTYLSCRRYLVEELGIDPSPSIVALYRSAVEAEEALE